MILVSGATGLVGGELVRLLREQGEPVRALVRSPAKAPAVEEHGAEVALGDLGRPDSLDSALQGVERVFIMCGSDARQIELEGNLIDAAARAGVGHAVKLSAIGAGLESPVAFARWHAEIEHHLERSGLPYTHLRPNGFMQDMLGNAPAIQEQGVIYAPMGNGRVSYIDARDVSAVAARALTSEGHEGRVYELTGPEALSNHDVAKRISEAIGKEVTYVDVPPEQARQGMLDTGMPEFYVDAILNLFDFYRQGSADGVTGDVEQVTGRPPRSYADFARDYAEAFGGVQAAG